ncbi:hypothetical protein BU24DRAFT_423493 [Aaosphaeria arxii CBS 175.79]|uniref:UBZ3-type domain-containing protein n=1 Tax=Aaosphaeria arxii CBS 175.79 TaxID=1450172 RepID=A0A6A5XNV5_9PLEO|nr:uncharacterized protein BU24DRAFT_423493 [Aaosphaeria arxii CBS 175.79]KAF2014586.1 hypothetical protein BU24DRAFT_423493 [Aaosphaeria arxii CBS 175.79]
MLAKLGSGYKKPNQQTVIRNRAVEHFLGEMKFTKIRMLGGKLGDEVVAMFGTDSVTELLKQPLEQLKRLGDDTGTWLYSTIRGEDNSEVNPRTQIKSMLSAKSFRPAINSFEQGVRWLRIFVADIYSRCVEEGVLENRRRPKTLNLHHRQGAQTRSRQGPIPQGKPFTEELLFDIAKNLLAQVVVDGRAWPCANLSLSAGGFEDGVTNTKGIGSFLVRGAEAKAMFSAARPASDSGPVPPPAKRRKKGNIANFFGPRDEKKRDFDAARAVLKAHRESTRESSDSEDDHMPEESDDLESFQTGDVDSPFERPSTPDRQDSTDSLHRAGTPPSAQIPTRSRQHGEEEVETEHMPSENHVLRQPTIEKFFCSRCNAHLPTAELAEHEDFHFAMDLSKEMRQEQRNQSNLLIAGRKSGSDKKPTRGRGRPPGGGSSSSKGGGGNSSDKGQAKLAFGRQT